MEKQEFIFYNTVDGKSNVALLARDGDVWMSQNQIAELFDTSVPNISMHVSNVFKDKELYVDSVVKDYLTTASDGKQYNVAFYSLAMILAIGLECEAKEERSLDSGQIKICRNI